MQFRIGLLTEMPLRLKNAFFPNLNPLICRNINLFLETDNKIKI